LGEDAQSTRSATVSSSVRDYVYENNRRYHAYREGKYLLPNDELEQDRLDLHHHVFRLMLGGRLHRAPLPPDVGRVLDYGTGTGIWALDFADEYQSAEVIGTDLSPIQPDWVSPNCKFYVDDVESEWTFGPDQALDYIHGRSMCGSIGDPPALYQSAYTHLKPGGWMEIQDFEAWIWQIDDPEGRGITNMTKWLGLLDEASAKVGKRINVVLEQKQHLIDAGFINVRDDVVAVRSAFNETMNVTLLYGTNIHYLQVPVGRWPKDKRLKELGMYQLEHMILSVEPYTLALFTRILGWTVEECQILMALVKAEFRSPKNHLISYFHFIYGQKPPAIRPD
jgi:SAM-dependent methyltransferase